MVAWITKPDWTSVRGRNLRVELRKNVGKPDDIAVLLTAVGISIADHPFGAGSTGRAIWESVTATETDLLPALLKLTADEYPALKQVIGDVLDADSGPTAQWYVATPPEDARLFGPRYTHSLIGRFDLGASLKNVCTNSGYLVLQIHGQKGMGKSHSRLLLEHMNRSAGSPWVVTGFDIADLWPPTDYATKKVGVRDFMEQLAAAVGMTDTTFPGVVDQDDTKRLARELVTAWVGRYSALSQPKPRILFIDGLDRLYLDVEAINVAIAGLARRIVVGDLTDVRLIVTGYTGTFDDPVVGARVEEWAEPFSDTHLIDFFTTIATQIQRKISAQDAADLMKKTLKTSSVDDHAALDQAATEVAREYFGSPA